MEGSSEDEKGRKEFFDQLFALDDESNGSQESQSVISNERRTKRRRTTTHDNPEQPKSLTPSAVQPQLNRSQSDPSPKSSSASDLASPDKVSQFNRLNHSLDGFPRYMIDSTAGVLHPPDTARLQLTMPPKRSRKVQAPKIPQERQIFRNLNFYFIPNDDIAPARRKRIEKCVDYGAYWSKEWNSNVTHVVVDKFVAFAKVLKHLKISEPKSDVAFVNETYPSECIGFQLMLEPSGRRFRITGHDLPILDPKEVEAPQPSQTKSPSPTRSEAQQLPSTPSAVEETSQSTSATRLGSEVAETQNEAENEQAQPSTTYQDDLNEIIESVKQQGDIPLDLEEESRPSSRPGPSCDSTSDTDDEAAPKALKIKNTGPTNFPNFSCMQKSEGDKDQDNPNSRTMAVLQQMASYYDRVGDEWRTRAYRKAIAELRRQRTKIMTRDQALHLPNIGDRLADKIEEIVWTNRLRRFESTSIEPNDKVLQLFMGIYQVGFPVASRWIAQGHRTLEDLKAKVDLTPNQRIGIDHYDDFLERIPRDEVTAHAAIVREEALKEDAGIEVIIGGSYRRGSSISGDIDLLITKKDVNMSQIKTIIREVISRLETSNFLVAGLATGHDKLSGSKWRGASCLPTSKIWRRIDFLFVPWDELGAALIYFTGNDIFNRSIRLLASRKGMRLNQRGLYGDVMRGPDRVNITEGRLIEGKDERRIFEVLGVPWRPPEHRIC